MPRLKTCKAPGCSVRKPREELLGPMREFCSPWCGLALADHRQRQAAERKRRQQRQKDKAKLEAMKPLTTLCSEAQKAVNKYIMARDRAAGYGCISCGSPDITEAGHYFHAGMKYRTSRLRFDHRVINAQCNHCNQHVGGGNQHGYRLGYISRYGEAAFEEMVDVKRQADCGELAPLTKDEVREIKAWHNAKRREIERGIE